MIVRVRFGKEGALCYIGHLDVLRTFQKIFRRAGIPLAYSKGFSPHPIMSFAMPLGLGLSSEGEYLDVEIEDTAVVDEKAFPSGEGGPRPKAVVDEVSLLSALRAATSAELPVYSLRVLPEGSGNAMASVGRAVYRLQVPEICREALSAAADSLLQKGSLPIEKKTKTQTVEMDLRPCIHELIMKEVGSLTMLFMTLSAGSKASVKPELVWEALLKEAGLSPEIRPVSIRRLDIQTEDGVSLGAIGEEPSC